MSGKSTLNTELAMYAQAAGRKYTVLGGEGGITGAEASTVIVDDLDTHPAIESFLSDHGQFAEIEAKLNSRRNIPASAPTDRKTRRALVKALGNRQFKKLYRKAQA